MKMEILYQIELLKSFFSKMNTSNNWLMGSITGISLAIPQWMYSKTITHYHAVLIGLLVCIMFLDILAGTTLAKNSSTQMRQSRVIYNTLVRNFIIISICMMSYGFDYLLGTYTFMFSIVTAAFILQNAYSFAGNIYVLGWTKHYPIWLFKLVKDEIEVKKEKYFPEKD